MIKKDFRSRQDKIFRYLKWGYFGKMIVDTTNFAVISYLEGFDGVWLFCALTSIVVFSYIAWNHHEVKRYREIQDCFDDWDNGIRTYEEIYPILVKHLPKDGILVQSKGR